MSSDIDFFATADDDWEPPVGVYSVVVTNAEAWSKDSDGKKFAKAYLRVTKGAHEGREFEHFMGFNSKAAANINKGALLMYGLPVKGWSFDDLIAGIDGLVGTNAEVAVKHKDGFVNVDVIRSFTEKSDLGNDQVAMFDKGEPATTGARNAIDDDLPY